MPVYNLRTERFAGKSAIVTGGGQGIGEACAKRLAGEGAAVAVVDISADHASRVASEIREQGGVAHALLADLEKESSVRAMVSEAERLLGSIDVSVHNVGGTIWGKPFWEYEGWQIEKEIARSLWPTLWCCHAILPHMVRRRSGSIVNIGSVAVRSNYRVPYAAAKGGVHAMTVSLAEDLADRGVRVNCVAPGGIDVGTRAIPRNTQSLSEQERDWSGEMKARTLAVTALRRYGKPEEVASAVCYLASEEASFITGEILYVGGGYPR
jgi:dihydroxycyclohexadiene carboxylate dehydrogenase